MLPGARLGNDALFAHPPGEEDLPQSIIYLMSTRMVQVFALEVNLTSILRAEPTCQIERRGTPDIIPKEPLIFRLEVLVLQDGKVILPQVLYAPIEDFRDIRPAKLSVITILVYLICFPFSL